jgi:hypothetical protein
VGPGASATEARRFPEAMATNPRPTTTSTPHRALDAAAPLKPLLPEPADLDQYHVRRQVRVSGLINEYRLVA